MKDKKPQVQEEEQELGPRAERLFKIFIILVMSILSLAMFYGGVTSIIDYSTKSDKQICEAINATLVNGLCHLEIDRTISERKSILLTGAIAFPIIAILVILYLVVILKYQFKEK